MSVKTLKYFLKYHAFCFMCIGFCPSVGVIAFVNFFVINANQHRVAVAKIEQQLPKITPPNQLRNNKITAFARTILAMFIVPHSL
jgi:hypothetical protein